MMYPAIDPVALSVGPITVYWYGLMYAFSMIIAWQLGVYRARQGQAPVEPGEVSDLILCWGIVGVVLGGRIGYVIFYQLNTFIHDPLYLIRIWEGGMSFHGGLVGVILVMWLYALKHKISLLKLMDFLAPLVPPGLCLGRIGNFINAELWGRVTTVPWGMIFPEAGNLPRHPTQLYEAFFEGVVFFIVLWWYSSKTHRPGQVSGFFLIYYASIRFLLEYLREPDSHMGFVLFNTLTQGQLLCVPMFLLGSYLLFFRKQRN